MRYSLLALPLLFAASAASAEGDGQSFEDIARGRYLATTGDCAACHTTPGAKPYAGGKPLETPFGTLLAPNLTPDRETGIGAWSDDEFVAAVRDGKSPHGLLYPAMPYPYYTKMTRDDVLAIRDYLATLDPVSNYVEANQLPFPFSIRLSMKAWNKLFFNPGEFEPVAGKSAAWNRGAYLVEGPGHCGACHTSKNALGADHSSHSLEGGALQGWYSPNITGDAQVGLGTWSEDDVVAYLKTGRNRITAATGPMAEVITNSTSKMEREDLAAIAVYLKELKPIESDANQAVPAADPAMRLGETVYVDQCAACHAATGVGVTGLFPALKGNPAVQSIDPTTLRRVVEEGARSVATDDNPTASAMPAFRWKLSDQEIAAVLTYIRNSWGNTAARVEP
jgi:mono/diheme cytochrome c family protein